MRTNTGEKQKPVVLTVRVSPKTYELILGKAKHYGVSMSAYMMLRAIGYDFSHFNLPTDKDDERYKVLQECEDYIQLEKGVRNFDSDNS